MTKKPTSGGPAPLWISYMPLADLEAAPRNPKAHDQAAISGSIEAFGFAEPIVRDERTGRIVSGHGRRESLLAMQAKGGEPPRGVKKGKDGKWLVPVLRGWASKDDAAAESFLLAANQAVIAGGWDQAALDTSLLRAAEAMDMTRLGFTTADLKGAAAAAGRSGQSPELARGGDTGGFDASPVRQIMLVYRAAEYEEVIRLLALARGKLGTETNTEAILCLLGRAPS